MALFSVAQLRAEIGGPSTDTRAAGHVLDRHLREIIDRHQPMLEQSVLQRLRRGEVALDGLMVSVKDIAVTTDANNPLVSSANIAQSYFPWPMALFTDAGIPYTYDPHMLTTTYVESPLFARYRYTIDGRKLYVTPPTDVTLKMNVMAYDDVVDNIGGDMTEQLRLQILKEAKAMLAARIAEGTRLITSNMMD